MTHVAHLLCGGEVDVGVVLFRGPDVAVRAVQVDPLELLHCLHRQLLVDLGDTGAVDVMRVHCLSRVFREMIGPTIARDLVLQNLHRLLLSLDVTSNGGNTGGNPCCMNL